MSISCENKNNNNYYIIYILLILAVFAEIISSIDMITYASALDEKP